MPAVARPGARRRAPGPQGRDRYREAGHGPAAEPAPARAFAEGAARLPPAAPAPAAAQLARRPAAAAAPRAWQAPMASVDQWDDVGGSGALRGAGPAPADARAVQDSLGCAAVGSASAGGAGPPAPAGAAAGRKVLAPAAARSPASEHAAQGSSGMEAAEEGLAFADGAARGRGPAGGARAGAAGDTSPSEAERAGGGGAALGVAERGPTGAAAGAGWRDARRRELANLRLDRGGRARPPGLRELCAGAGLRTNGRKAELVERLLEHEAAAPSGGAAPAA
jgi:hypothetical protein